MKMKGRMVIGAKNPLFSMVLQIVDVYIGEFKPISLNIPFRRMSRSVQFVLFLYLTIF